VELFETILLAVCVALWGGTLFESRGASWSSGPARSTSRLPRRLARRLARRDLDRQDDQP
jgi:hypothetical protein